MKNKEINLGYVGLADYTKKTPLFELYAEKGDDDYEEQLKEHQKNLAKYPENEQVIATNQELTMTIDYPLRNPFKCKIDTSKGLTRRELVTLIAACYKQIYKEEDAGTKVKPGYIPGMFNRNTTDGKYGIWWHCLGDLILHTATIEGNELSVACDS